MHTYVLQDWITMKNNTASGVVLQGENGWLDMAPYQDVNFWIDCREVSGGTVYINFQTSPQKEDFLFLSMFGATTISLTTSTSNSNPYRVLLSMPSLPNGVPLARYLRWQLTGPASTWDTTFRVLVTANALGL